MYIPHIVSCLAWFQHILTNILNPKNIMTIQFSQNFQTEILRYTDYFD